MNLRAQNRFVPFVSLVSLGLIVGCAGSIGDNGEVDAELSVAEVADLPIGDEEVDVAELTLADATPVEDDAANFETDEAEPTEDFGVDDDDLVEAAQGLIGAEAVAAATGPTSAAVSSDRFVDDPVAPRLTLLKWGMHPRASNAMRAIGISASRIMQTIGNARASAGTHRQDGTVNGHPYCAATDISVRGLSNTQIRHLLERLGRVGFAAWYRQPGHDGWPSSQVRHIHAVYANAKMKTSLRSQVRSWLVGRNGLRSNAYYGFYRWSSTAKATVRHKFAQSAHGTTNAGADCFVGGYYCGGDKISGDRNTLYRCTGTGAPAVIRHCASGCAVRPGQDDACR
jgi:hypothetical protein